jgi:hypothetical protein
MLRIRHRWLVAVIAAGGLALVAACKKDDKADTAGGKTGTAEKPGASDDLTYLPIDSEVVFGVNFAQIAQSAVWKQFVEPKLNTGSGEMTGKIAEFKAKCGYDPVGSLKSLSVGGKGEGANGSFVAVIHGLDKAKAWACVDKMKDDIAKGGEFTRDGDIALFKAKDGAQVAVTFVNDSTAIAVGGPQANPAGVKAASAGGSALKTSPAFVAMYGKVKTGDSLWFLVNAKPLEQFAAFGLKANAAYGSLNAADGLALDMRIRTESPDAAAQLANLLKTQGQNAAKMFDQVDFQPDGNEVKCTVVLSSQKLQSLITTFGGMFGAMGGMGGH